MIKSEVTVLKTNLYASESYMTEIGTHLVLELTTVVPSTWKVENQNQRQHDRSKSLSETVHLVGV